MPKKEKKEEESRRIDYNTLPQVQEMRKRHTELLDPENKELDEKQREQYKNASNMMVFEEGKELWLRVRVNDSFLFREIVGSMYSDKSALSIPGAELRSINWDMDHRDTLREWLQDQLMRLENESGNHKVYVEQEIDNEDEDVVIRVTRRDGTMAMIRVPFSKLNKEKQWYPGEPPLEVDIPEGE